MNKHSNPNRKHTGNKDQSGDRNESQAPNSGQETVEVLYQRLGDRWYAFSLINDEVFVGKISEMRTNTDSDAEAKPVGHSERRAGKTFRIAGHS